MSVECCICNTLPCTLPCTPAVHWTEAWLCCSARVTRQSCGPVSLKSDPTQQHSPTHLNTPEPRTTSFQGVNHSEEQSSTVSPARAWLLEQGRTFKPLIRQNWSVWQDWSSFSQNFPHHLLSSNQTEGSWMNVFEILFQCFIFTWPGEVIGDTCYLQTRRASKDITWPVKFFFSFLDNSLYWESSLRSYCQRVVWMSISGTSSGFCWSELPGSNSTQLSSSPSDDRKLSQHEHLL